MVVLKNMESAQTIKAEYFIFLDGFPFLLRDGKTSALSKSVDFIRSSEGGGGRGCDDILMEECWSPHFKCATANNSVCFVIFRT